MKPEPEEYDALRKRLEVYNLAQVAARSGVDYQRLLRFYNGACPKLSTIEGLRVFFDEAGQ